MVGRIIALVYKNGRKTFAQMDITNLLLDISQA